MKKYFLAVLVEKQRDVASNWSNPRRYRCVRVKSLH